MPNKKSNTAGFTLVDITIAIVVIGLFLSAVAGLTTIYLKKKRHDDMISNISHIDTAIAKYVDIHSSYPCPAPLDAAAFSAEDGRATAISNNGTVSCNTNLNGIHKTTGRAGKEIAIGALPYRDLNIPVDVAIDRYGNRLTYAVSIDSTDPTKFNNDLLPDKSDVTANHTGAISVTGLEESLKGQTQKSSAPPPPPPPLGSDHYFFFTHGANGKGAYTRNGVATSVSCDDGTSKDAENCDYDDAQFYAGDRSFGDNDNYNDDYTNYALKSEFQSDEHWSLIPGTKNITNKNDDEVFVNDNLSVSGATEITGSLSAGSYIDVGTTSIPCEDDIEGALRYLESTDYMQYCNDGDWIDIPRAPDCAENEVITEENGKLRCILPPTALTIPACTANQYLVGTAPSTIECKASSCSCTPKPDPEPKSEPEDPPVYHDPETPTRCWDNSGHTTKAPDYDNAYVESAKFNEGVENKRYDAPTAFLCTGGGEAFNKHLAYAWGVGYNETCVAWWDCKKEDQIEKGCAINTIGYHTYTYGGDGKYSTGRNERCSLETFSPHGGWEWPVKGPVYTDHCARIKFSSNLRKFCPYRGSTADGQRDEVAWHGANTAPYSMDLDDVKTSP